MKIIDIQDYWRQRLIDTRLEIKDSSSLHYDLNIDFFDELEREVAMCIMWYDATHQILAPRMDAVHNLHKRK